MKIEIVFIVLLLALITPLKAQQYKLEAGTIKNTYLVGEPMNAWIGIKNIGTIKVSLTYQMKIQLFDGNGKELEYEGILPENFSPRGRILKPGGETYSLFEINDLFGKLYYKTAWRDHYLEPGKYTMLISFYPSNERKQITKVTFSVKQPTGRELIVYNAFMDLIKGEVTSKYSEKQVAEHAASLYEAHPNSAYSIVILHFLDAVYLLPLQEYAKSKDVERMIVEKYPLSVVGWRMLEGVLKSMKSDSEKIDYLNNLRVKTKGTIMEKMYGKKIIGIENEVIKLEK